MIFVPPLIFIILIILVSAMKICRKSERVLVFRFGRLIPPARGPGVFLTIPIVDRLKVISLRTVIMDVSPHEFSTMDRGDVRLDASVSFRVVDPVKAITEVENYSHGVENYLNAMSELAIRSFADALRELKVSQILTSRNTLINRVRTELEQGSKPWGIEIVDVQIKGLKSPV